MNYLESSWIGANITILGCSFKSAQDFIDTFNKIIKKHSLELSQEIPAIDLEPTENLTPMQKQQIENALRNLPIAVFIDPNKTIKLTYTEPENKFSIDLNMENNQNTDLIQKIASLFTDKHSSQYIAVGFNFVKKYLFSIPNDINFLASANNEISTKIFENKQVLLLNHSFSLEETKDDTKLIKNFKIQKEINNTANEDIRIYMITANYHFDSFSSMLSERRITNEVYEIIEKHNKYKNDFEQISERIANS